MNWDTQSLYVALYPSFAVITHPLSGIVGSVFVTMDTNVPSDSPLFVLTEEKKVNGFTVPVGKHLACVGGITTRLCCTAIRANTALGKAMLAEEAKVYTKIPTAVWDTLYMRGDLDRTGTKYEI